MLAPHLVVEVVSAVVVVSVEMVVVGVVMVTVEVLNLPLTSSSTVLGQERGREVGYTSPASSLHT